MSTAAAGTLRRLDEGAGRGVVRFLVWLGLVVKPGPEDVFRFSRIALRAFCWTAVFAGLGIGIPLVVNVAIDSGPALFEGRLGRFIDTAPARVSEVVEDDWFADGGRALTSLGIVHHAYSPVADTFTVRVEGYHVRIDQVALICPGPAVIEFYPSSDDVAYLQQPPWPCQTLVLALSRTDTDDSTVVTISLDGSPLPGNGGNDAVA